MKREGGKRKLEKTSREGRPHLQPSSPLGGAEGDGKRMSSGLTPRGLPTWVCSPTSPARIWPRCPRPLPASGPSPSWSSGSLRVTAWPLQGSLARGLRGRGPALPAAVLFSKASSTQRETGQIWDRGLPAPRHQNRGSVGSRSGLRPWPEWGREGGPRAS